MFDIGWQEIFLIAVVALLIIGPKDLPRTLRTVTGVLRKVKGMARDFQSGLDDIVRESDLAEMRREIEAGPGGDIRKQIEDSIDPEGTISKDLDDMREFEGDLTKAAKGYGDEVKKTETEARADLPDANEAMTAPPAPPEPPKETAASGETPKKD